MTDLSQIIQGRRTIHQFVEDKPVADELINAALDHAVCAPNHYHTRPWHFYLLKRETVKQVCELNAALLVEQQGKQSAAVKLRRWLQVPGWLLLTCDINEDPVRMDEDYAACCCAAQNMMLYLWQQGVGVKWTTGEVTRAQRFFQLMQIDPAREKVVGLFWYGYPAEVPSGQRQPGAEWLQHR
ncbi:MAG: nitroreductase family protein [Gammaproteobacteria bacterium]